MRRLFAILIMLAMVGGSFGPSLADGPGGGSPCTPVTLEQCVATDSAAFVLPTENKGSCGLKAIGAQALCHAHEPRAIRVAVSEADRALLPAFLPQPERPPRDS